MTNFSRLAKSIFIGLIACALAHCTASNNPFVDRSATNANGGKPSQDGEGLDGFLGKIVVSADGSTTAHFPKGSYPDQFAATLESTRTRDFDSVLAEAESKGEMVVLGAPMELVPAGDLSLKAPFRVALRFNSEDDISKALVLVKAATGNFALTSDMYGVRTLVDGRREIFFMTDMVGTYSVVMQDTAGTSPAGFSLFPAPREVARFRAEWTSNSTLKLVWTTGAGRPMISWDTSQVPTDCTQFNVINPDVIGDTSIYELGGLDRRQTFYFRHCSISPFPGFATLGIDIAIRPSCDETESNNVPFANWENGIDPGDPTFICSAAQLNRINDGETYDGVTPAQRMTRTYVLKADIDMIGVDYKVIGTSDAPFSGTFDGGSHKILNFYVDRPESDHLGLIGVLIGGDVKNVTIVVDRVNGREYVGGAIGRIGGNFPGSTTVSGVRVFGAASDGSSSIIGLAYVGGIIGYHYTELPGNFHMNNSSAENVTVLGTSWFVGGIIGRAIGSQDGSYSCIINGSYSNAMVGAGTHVGGFAGEFAREFKVRDSYAAGDMNFVEIGMYSEYSGGFVGGAAVPTELTRVYASGNVREGENSGSSTGPLVGGQGIGNVVLALSTFYDSDSTKWSTSPVGTAATTVALTTDSNGNGIVDALDNEGWDPAVWELDPVVLKGRRPMLKWQLSEE